MTAPARHLPLVPDSPLAHYEGSIPGFFWFEEAYRRLVASLPTDQPSQWVEIGCFQGKSLCWLGVEILNRQLPVTIHAVDSWMFHDPTESAVIHAAFIENIAPFRERVRVWHMPSLEAVKHFADSSLDVVFVDGDHEYAAAKADILAWWPKLKPGGLMAGDDFQMKPVADAVIEQFAPSGYILVHGWGQADGRMQPWPTWIARREA